MNKTLNLVSYMPGHGGNFIRFLLCLAPNTAPCLPQGYTGDEPRVKIYSFKNLMWKYTSWCNFHEVFEAVDKWDVDPFLNQDEYDTYSLCLHPGWDTTKNHFFMEEFLNHNKDKLGKFDKINYFKVSMSDQYEDYIEKFKDENMRQMTIMNGVKKWLPPWLPVKGGKQFNEIKEANEKFEKDFNPHIINLDNFFFGTDRFTEEYIKFIDYAGLPRMLPEAQELYEGWASSRRLHKHFNW